MLCDIAFSESFLSISPADEWATGFAFRRSKAVDIIVSLPGTDAKYSIDFSDWIRIYKSST